MTNGKVIPMPCPTVWQAQQRKKSSKGKFLLTLESLVTVTIGVCALMSTTVFVFMCM